MREEFGLIGKKLFEEGLTGAVGGSMSVREGEKIFITKKNAMLSELGGQDIVEAGIEGDADPMASPDLAIHRAIYQNSSAAAVICANPPFATAKSLTEEKMVPADILGKQTLKSIPVIRVREPVSNDEIIRFLAPTFKSGYSCAMVRGIASYAASATLKEALMLTSVLERSCKIGSVAKGLQEPARPQKREERPKQQGYRSAIPPSIGVMDRSYRGKR